MSETTNPEKVIQKKQGKHGEIRKEGAYLNRLDKVRRNVDEPPKSETMYLKSFESGTVSENQWSLPLKVQMNVH